MKSKFSILAIALTPFLANAQLGSEGFASTVDGFLAYLLYIAGRALPLLILAALLFFLWGIFKIFFWDRGHDDPKNKTFILWGVVALFVMVSVWGLVNVLRDTLRLDNSRVPSAPAIPFPAAPATNSGGLAPAR